MIGVKTQIRVKIKMVIIRYGKDWKGLKCLGGGALKQDKSSYILRNLGENTYKQLKEVRKERKI